jgi:fatty acid desaturase
MLNCSGTGTSPLLDNQIFMYFWQPISASHYAVDILLRTYLLSMIVPFNIFRKEHLQHHAATNIPGKDPDEFMNTKRKWEIPIRAVALPFHWGLWLRRNRRLTRRDVIQNLVSIAVSITTYAGIAYVMGPSRVLLGFIPVVFLLSFFFWYTFAVKTHEGYSTGDPETRSHDYRGSFFYWATFGLSLHRTHHLKPRLSWVQMAGHAQRLSCIDRKDGPKESRGMNRGSDTLLDRIRSAEPSGFRATDSLPVTPEC